MSKSTSIPLAPLPETMEPRDLDLDRKPRSPREWILWIAVTLALSYPLSLGPVFWITSRFKTPEHAFALLTPVYLPVIATLIECPHPVREIAAHYLSLGAPRGVSIHIINDGLADKGFVSEHPGYTYTWIFY